jgi:hypothetical protein
MAAWVAQRARLVGEISHFYVAVRGAALLPAKQARHAKLRNIGLHAPTSIRSCLEHDTQRVDPQLTDGAPAEPGAYIPPTKTITS